MAITFVASAALTAASAAAIIWAPTAGAADCVDNGPSSVCTRNGHAAIVAEPQPTDRGVILAPGGGAGPNPPIMAMD